MHRDRPPNLDKEVEMAERSERTSYAPGTPSWVDLGSPDPDGCGRVLRRPVRLEGRDGPPPGGRRLRHVQLDGKNVAGLGPQMNTDMPPFWTVYVTVADADETLKKVAANGGTAVMGPMEVFDAGRMGVAQDPSGSFISVWQPNQHIGAQLVNEPGTFGWNELSDERPGQAKAFYTAVFGWGIDANASSDGGASSPSTANIVCGAHTAGEGEFPAWSVWFAVDDCDASAAKAERARRLGGDATQRHGLRPGRHARRPPRRRLRHRRHPRRRLSRTEPHPRAARPGSEGGRQVKAGPGTCARQPGSTGAAGSAWNSASTCSAHGSPVTP